MLEALKKNKEGWCEGGKGFCGLWNSFVKTISMTETYSCVGLTWGRAMDRSEKFWFHFINHRLLSWRPILCTPLCGNNLATHDHGWLCLSLLDYCVIDIVMGFLFVSGYPLIRSHVSFGGGVTGPTRISAMRCGLDLCFAIERAWPLLGLAHPGRDHFSR